MIAGGLSGIAEVGVPVIPAAAREGEVLALRSRCLSGAANLPWTERGAILALLGSAERAFMMIERIDAERRSVPRTGLAPVPSTPAY